ncbi:hypothetical protein, partial [Klebsiella pneumoniae]|uniref:hypothetical protein n=1 Tax=Klebsiella pneumoniae TaxID=573 RepID=UPI0022B70661
GLAAFTGKLTVGKSQLLAHPVTHSGFRLQHDDLTSRTYSHLPLVNLHFPYKFRESESLKSFLANEVKEGKNADKNVNQYKSKFFAK